jgi:excisionase family DNA binding protein
MENSIKEKNHLEKFWKITEAAAFLNISPGTLYHWVSQKRLPCTRFGSRCLRFNPEQLKQWAAGQDTDNHIRSSAIERSEKGNE